jgi:cyclic pyranopterin phosphate synthase
VDLRAALRSGAGPDQLRALVRDAWTSRDDRGAEVRLALGSGRANVPVIPVKALRRDPHLEMHTRGG